MISGSSVAGYSGEFCCGDCFLGVKGNVLSLCFFSSENSPHLDPTIVTGVIGGSSSIVFGRGGRFRRGVSGFRFKVFRAVSSCGEYNFRAEEFFTKGGGGGGIDAGKLPPDDELRPSELVHREADIGTAAAVALLLHVGLQEDTLASSRTRRAQPFSRTRSATKSLSKFTVIVDPYTANSLSNRILSFLVAVETLEPCTISADIQRQKL